MKIMGLPKNLISFFCFIAVFLCNAEAAAEVVPDKSVIYDAPSGEGVLMLKAPIEFVPPNLELGVDKDWIRVRFLATLDKITTTQESIVLSPGTNIYHPRFRKEIAVVLRDMTVLLSPLYNEESDESTTIEVDGFIEMENILGGMPIEDDLNFLIGSGWCGLDSLKKHLAIYAYAKWFDGDFMNYAVGGDGVRDPSPRPRIILFFNENKLIAISHKRNYIFSGFEKNNGVRGEYISYSKYAKAPLMARFKEYYNDMMLMID